MKEIRKIIESKNNVHMEKLSDIFEELLTELQHQDPTKYLEILYCLHILAYGNHLDEALAYDWVEHLQNKDGSTGEHWTYEQSKQYAGLHDTYDFYTILNTMYSQHYNSKFDTNIYVQLADDWLNDKNNSGGEALKYYFCMVKK